MTEHQRSGELRTVEQAATYWGVTPSRARHPRQPPDQTRQRLPV